MSKNIFERIGMLLVLCTACDTGASRPTIHLCPRGDSAEITKHLRRSILRLVLLDGQGQPVGSPFEVESDRMRELLDIEVPSSATSARLTAWDGGAQVASGQGALTSDGGCVCFSTLSHYPTTCEDVRCRFEENECQFFDTDGFPVGLRTLSFGENTEDDVQSVVRDVVLAKDNPAHVGSNGPRLEMDPLHVSLIRFDLGPFPGNAMIESTQLILATCNTEVVCDSPTSVRVYEIQQAWDSTATWSERSSGSPWLEPGCGGDCRADLITMFAGPFTINQVYQTDVTASVSEWVRDSTTNHGFLLQSEHTNGIDFNSSESTADGFRPRLEIRYRLN